MICDMNCDESLIVSLSICPLSFDVAIILDYAREQLYLVRRRLRISDPSGDLADLFMGSVLRSQSCRVQWPGSHITPLWPWTHDEDEWRIHSVEMPRDKLRKNRL
jgi:hypothetical protein